MRILGIIQARMSSTRLPGKILRPILGQAMLALQVERTLRCKSIDRLVVATSSESSDDPVVALCEAAKIPIFRGKLNDVLDRLYHAAAKERPEHVVRLTGDCPLIDPGLIERIVQFHLAGTYDYSSNTLKPTFPDGLDIEIMTFDCLAIAWQEACLPSEREHVTPFIKKRSNRFRLGSFEDKTDLSDMRWTVDEPKDFEFVERVYEMLYPSNPAFSSADILALLEREPELATINSGITRDTGYLASLEEDKKSLSNCR